MPTMARNEIRQAGNGKKTFYVTGDSGKEYMVTEKRDPIQHRNRWMCTCMDFIVRRFEHNENCKHIEQVLEHVEKSSRINQTFYINDSYTNKVVGGVTFGLSNPQRKMLRVSIQEIYET
jgi:hypothetical protein